MDFVVTGPVSDDEYSTAFIQKLSLLTEKMFLNTLFPTVQGPGVMVVSHILSPQHVFLKCKKKIPNHS